MLPSPPEITEKEVGLAKRAKCLDGVAVVPVGRTERQQSIGRLAGNVQLGAHQMKGPASPQDDRQLRRLAKLLAQLMRASIGGFHLVGREASEGKERRTAKCLNFQFEPVPRNTRRQMMKGRHRLSEV